MKTRLSLRTVRWLFPVLLIVSLAGCVISRSAVTGTKRAYAYSWEQEKQIGQQADQQIMAQFGVYQDERLNNYVATVGQQVLQNSHLRRPDATEEHKNTEFTFRVLDSPVVNAFALPGGYVYVTRGLLAHLENEAQLGVVLGHEIGHVVARHSSQRALSGTLAQVGLIAGAIGGEMLGMDGNSILQGGSMAAQLLMLRYSRSDEREADALGVEYASMTGYDAAEAAEFFQSLARISEQSGSAIPGFLSTHPDPGDREEKIPEMAQTYRDEYEMTEVGADEYMSALQGMVYGEDPRQGFFEDGMFYHPELAFAFPVPTGWQYQNTPQQVAMISGEQDAYMIFNIDSEASSPQNAASRLASQEGIQVLDSRSTTVNGMQAHVLDATAVDQNQNQLRILAYLIGYEGRVYRIIGLTSADRYESYQRLFLNSMRGFQRVTDRNILNRQPMRVRVTQASRSAPFQALIPGDLPDPVSAEELAIINQVYLDSVVQQGTRLKMVSR